MSSSSRTLPSRVAPQSRVRSDGRARDEDDRPRTRPLLPSTPRATTPQSLRTSDRSRPPPSRSRPPEARTISSTSSSSASSSLLDRMKVRGGEVSSRTSLDEDYEELPKRGDRWTYAKSRRAVPAEKQDFDDEGGNQDSDPAKERDGYGYDLWGRVTAVASNLTVNVSKAWEKGLGTVDGEDTPPGQESRLTKAMKAYHLDRAKSPADLPAWLFDERERGVAQKPWNVAKTTEYEDRFLPEPNPGGSSFRDIYDKAATSATSVSNSSRRTAEPSGAANRLKAIREAKRSAMQVRSDTEGGPSSRDNRRGDSLQTEPKQSAAVARVGLPSRPGRLRHV